MDEDEWMNEKFGVVRGLSGGGGGGLGRGIVNVGGKVGRKEISPTVIGLL